MLIEDSFIHSYYMSLVWLLLACQQGYKLTVRDVEFILGTVKTACTVSICDELDKGKPYQNVTVTELLKASHSEQSLILRSLAGGTKDDLQMVAHIAKVWSQRIDHKRKHNLYQETVVEPIELDKVQDISVADIIEAAIDYHCMPKILTGTDTKYSRNKMKLAIWFHSSALISKMPLDKDSKRLFKLHDGQAEHLHIWHHIKLVVDQNRRDILDDLLKEEKKMKKQRANLDT